MRYFIFSVLFLLPICVYSDTISTKHNGNIEDVKVVSIAADSVKYKQGDILKAIASHEVQGVLYDNGKFVIPPSLSHAVSQTANDNSWDIDNANSIPKDTKLSSSYNSNKSLKGGKKFFGEKIIKAWTLKTEQIKAQSELRKQAKQELKEQIKTQFQQKKDQDSNNNKTIKSNSSDDENW